jgi:hypothetical protein
MVGVVDVLGKGWGHLDGIASGGLHGNQGRFFLNWGEGGCILTSLGKP